jgi:hypothetical protein
VTVVVELVVEVRGSAETVQLGGAAGPLTRNQGLKRGAEFLVFAVSVPVRVSHGHSPGSNEVSDYYHGLVVIVNN